jgi:hypothetical protein
LLSQFDSEFESTGLKGLERVFVDPNEVNRCAQPQATAQINRAKAQKKFANKKLHEDAFNRQPVLLEEVARY